MYSSLCRSCSDQPTELSPEMKPKPESSPGDKFDLSVFSPIRETNLPNQVQVSISCFISLLRTKYLLEKLQWRSGIEPVSSEKKSGQQTNWSTDELKGHCSSSHFCGLYLMPQPHTVDVKVTPLTLMIARDTLNQPTMAHTMYIYITGFSPKHTGFTFFFSYITCCKHEGKRWDRVAEPTPQWTNWNGLTIAGWLYIWLPLGWSKDTTNSSSNFYKAQPWVMELG